MSLPRTTGSPMIIAPPLTEAALRLVSTPTDEKTSLEQYLDALCDLPETDRRVPLARRLNSALLKHEVEVLLAPHHVPGQRADTDLWVEISRASSSRSASIRMVARVVEAHLGDHEADIIASVHLIDDEFAAATNTDLALRAL